MGQSEEKPFDAETTELTHERVLCLRHGEVFREKWPSGYPLFLVMAFQKVDEQTPANEYPVKEGMDKEQRARAVEAWLDINPLCCRLSPDGLLKLYLEIHKELGEDSPFKRESCQNCRSVAPGAPYRIQMGPRGPLQRYRHVCFYCVIHRMVRLNPGAN